MPSGILAQSITATAITLALSNGTSVVFLAANIPVSSNTPALASASATTALQNSITGTGSGVNVGVHVYSLGPPIVWTVISSDQAIPANWWAATPNG